MVNKTISRTVHTPQGTGRRATNGDGGMTGRPAINRRIAQPSAAIIAAKM